jgi:hypothetical protein
MTIPEVYRYCSASDHACGLPEPAFNVSVQFAALLLLLLSVLGLGQYPE